MNPENTSSITRRDALARIGAGVAVVSLGSSLLSTRAEAQTAAPAPAEFTLPPLGFAYDALEPAIDARTMEIHYTKHHQAYVTNANKALAAYPELRAKGAEGILKEIRSVPEAIQTIVRNNVGGHVNHCLFWRILKPGGAKQPVGKVAEAIDKTFGGFDGLHAELTSAASRHFGSGWGWLSVNNGDLAVQDTSNQDSPLMFDSTPLLGIDVWEHAYYLNYQNRRSDYINAFWSLVNWDVVNENYIAATEPDKEA